MKIELELQVPDAKGEIIDLKEDFQDKNLSGVKIAEKKTKGEDGTMAGAELQPILELMLSPAVSIAVATGVFKVIKDFMELRKHKITKEAEQQQVVLTKKGKEGVVETFKMSLFSEDERKKFMEFFKGE